MERHGGRRPRQRVRRQHQLRVRLPDVRPGFLALVTPDGSARTVADDLQFPDGIRLDADGAVWYADVPNRHCRRVAEGGAVLDTVDVGLGCFACVLGGPDRRTLYIVAADWRDGAIMMSDERTGRVISLDVDVPGDGRP